MGTPQWSLLDPENPRTGGLVVDFPRLPRPVSPSGCDFSVCEPCFLHQCVCVWRGRGKGLERVGSRGSLGHSLLVFLVWLSAVCVRHGPSCQCRGQASPWCVTSTPSQDYQHVTYHIACNQRIIQTKLTSVVQNQTDDCDYTLYFESPSACALVSPKAWCLMLLHMVSQPPHPASLAYRSRVWRDLGGDGTGGSVNWVVCRHPSHLPVVSVRGPGHGGDPAPAGEVGVSQLPVLVGIQRPLVGWPCRGAPLRLGCHPERSPWQRRELGRDCNGRWTLWQCCAREEQRWVSPRSSR